MKSGSFQGEPIPELVCRNTELRINGLSYTFLLAGELTDGGELTWGTPATDFPATLHCQHGANAGRRTECRFSTRGQLLRLTCAFPDPADPKLPAHSYTALFSRLPPT